MIPDELKKELKVRVSAAITPREAAVDVMKELQAHYGWLTDEAVGEAAELLGLSPLQVEELATFYEMIYRRPVGKRVIHVSGDGVFTLIPCCCLGNCGEGPTMMVGDALYGRLTPEKVDEILEKERKA